MLVVLTSPTSPPFSPFTFLLCFVMSLNAQDLGHLDDSSYWPVIRNTLIF